MILFVCSQGRIRSRTAEVLTLLGGMQARCCGTDADAMVPINNALLRAADTIVCMEREHSKLVNEYMGSEGKIVVSLGIRDVWTPFCPLLIEQLIRLTRLRLDDDLVADTMERGFRLIQANAYNFLGGTLDESHCNP